MKFDITIVGGGTAGCACAYIAGKNGLKTLLIEKNNYLGGTMTSSLVTPAMKTSDIAINNIFFKDLVRNLRELGGQITYPDNDNQGWFNPELLKITLDSMLSSENITILFDSQIDDLKILDNNVKSLKIYNNSKYTDKKVLSFDNNLLSEYIDTKYIVDATGNAKIFEKLNCDFLENKNNFQPINLRFIMGGINLEKFSEWILDFDKDRTVTTSYKIGNEIHLSTAYTWDNNKNWALRPLFEQGILDGIITEEDSNYFQLFTIPGMSDSVAFNCPRLLIDTNYEDNDKIVKSRYLKQGRASILRLSKFLKKYFIGFENSYISSIANDLGVRVSRRIKGEYIYTIEDLKSGKTFNNPCVISNYPVDVHSSKQDKSILSTILKEYSLPIEALKSCNYENLYAIGRCISADFMSQAALRIIPSCFSMGEGLANYLTKKLK